MYCVHYLFLLIKGILNGLYQDVLAGVYLLMFQNSSDNIAKKLLMKHDPSEQLYEVIYSVTFLL